MGQILAFLFFSYLIYLFLFPDTNSTSYRLGKGTGNKVRQFGDWLTKD